MKVLSFAVALTAGMVAFGMASPSVAGEKQTFAAGACKSALPIFDGNIRSRPLAVQNEGTSSAFVTCTQQGDFDDDHGYVMIILVNTSAVAASINCTMVSGSNVPYYQVESILVPAGARDTRLRFYPDDGTSFQSSLQAFSCNLPPGTGISRVATIPL